MERNPTNLEMMCYFALRASLPALSAPRAPRCCVWPHSRLLADCSGSTQQQQPHSKQQQQPGHRNSSSAGPRTTAPRTPPTLNFPEPGLVHWSMVTPDFWLFICSVSFVAILKMRNLCWVYYATTTPEAGI